MKFKLSLSLKLQVYIISITAFFMIAAILYISSVLKESSINDVKENTNEIVSKQSKIIENKFNTDISVIRTLAQSMQVYNLLDSATWESIFPEMYSEVLKNNKQFDDIWDSWELSVINKNWKKSYGRYAVTVYNTNSKKRIQKEFKSLDGDSEDYLQLKMDNKETVNEPYLFNFEDNNNEEVLITDITVPIQDKNGNFIGIVGADIRLTKIQKIINQIKPFENSSAYLISNKGVYTSHPDANRIGDAAKNDFPNIDIVSNIQKSKIFNFSNFDKDNNEFYYVFYPIQIGKTSTPWSIGIKIPMQTIINDATITSRKFLLLGFIILFIIALVIAFLARRITQPLRKITKILTKLSDGVVHEDMQTNYKTGDEIEDISNALNKTVSSLLEKTEFASKIGQNEIDIELKLLSEDDTLGKALVEMQSNLKEAKRVEEIRKKEDYKRQWANQGLAKFADIFRQNNDSMENLANIFTSEIIKYNNANQGTLFLKQNDEFLSLATYAYDRDKFTESSIKPGEGLVGTCIVERKSTYITDIPQGYVKITSGLGEATPTSLFICPIQTDNEVVGVFEMAAFEEIEAYQREFIETICTNLASVVESVKINDNTKILLEQTQQQAEEMKAQEEEMRQNLEELQATQEEMAAKTSEINGVINALNTSSLVLKLDMNGILIDINDSFLKLLELPKEGVIGQDLKNFTNFAEDKEAYEKFWENLRQGIPQKDEQLIKLSNGKEIWLSQVFSTIFNENNEPVNIMNIATDITQRKLQEIEVQQQNEEMSAQEEEMRQNLEELETTQEEMAAKTSEINSVINALNSSSLVLKLDMNGTLIDINDSFLKLFELPKEGILGRNLKDFTNIANDEKAYKKFWENLNKGIPQKDEQLIKLSNGKEIWLSQVFSTIFDENDNPVSIMDIASDITQRKIQEIEMQQQNEEMSAQEEMMRLNMEEIEEMQNEVDIKDEEINGLLNALNASNFIVEYDTAGKVIEINDKYLSFLGLTKKEALEMTQADNFKTNKQNKHFWNILLKGESWKGETTLEINNQSIKLMESYAPIRNNDGEIIKILKIANNINDFKAS